MPAFSTHYIFAKEMMPWLKENSDFKIDDSAVFFGTQGPDILFFHRLFPWMIGKSLRGVGSILHRVQPSKLFDSMRDYIAVSGDKEIALSYAYGFMLHYALDRSCHPYVYSLQEKICRKNKRVNPFTAHNIIEFSMDAYLLNKRLNISNIAKFKTADAITITPALSDEIGKLLSYVICDITDKKVTQKQAATALYDTKYIQKISSDPTGVKRVIVSIFDAVTAPISHNLKFSAMMRPKDLEKAKKYGNIDRQIWKSPYSNETSDNSFEDLFELAMLDAKRMITDFQLGKDTREITNNISFLTGVEVK